MPRNRACKRRGASTQTIRFAVAPVDQHERPRLLRFALEPLEPLPGVTMQGLPSTPLPPRQHSLAQCEKERRSRA